MSEKRGQKLVCTHVFQNTEEPVLRERMTKKWAELIKRLEKERLETGEAR